MLRSLFLLLPVHVCTAVHVPTSQQSYSLLPASTFQIPLYNPGSLLNSYGSFNNLQQVGNPALKLQPFWNPALPSQQFGSPVQSVPQYPSYPIYTLGSPLPGPISSVHSEQGLQPLFKKPNLQNLDIQEKVKTPVVQKSIGVLESKFEPTAAIPIPYLDPRALCSFCSCEDDLGCGYNCNKCNALCTSCDCDKSLGCKYNCDKCEEGSSNSYKPSKPISTDQLTLEISQDFLNLNSSNGSGSSWQAGQPAGGDTSSEAADQCDQLRNTQIELCMWGPSCHSIISNVFPNCNYSCNTCQLNPSSSCVASSGEAAGQPCVFPFVYKGVKYNGCAPLHSGSDGLKFWCSTKTDVNGYHIRGPYSDPGKYVGFCDASCPKDLPGFF